MIRERRLPVNAPIFSHILALRSNYPFHKLRQIGKLQ